MSENENQPENQVNEETAAAPAQAGQRTVTAQAVLLSAVELAQSRGAYRVNEMALITEAHRIVTAQETARLQAAAPAEESSEGGEEASESSE
tara:strand:- start:1191 stop:1466 length:276 start_codon:yes stop_codon:yes gene_type:complete